MEFIPDRQSRLQLFYKVKTDEENYFIGDSFGRNISGNRLPGRICAECQGQDKLYTLAFPGQQLLTVAMTDKAPAYIWCRMIPMKDAPDV